VPVREMQPFDLATQYKLLSASEFHYHEEQSCVRYRIHFECVLPLADQFERFPFDRQMLNVRLNAPRNKYWRLITQQPVWVDNVLNPAKYHCDQPLFSQLLQGVSGWTHPQNPLILLPEGRRKQTFLMIPVERATRYYLLNVILPLFLIIGMAPTSVASQDTIGNRLFVTLTLTLTVVAFKVAISSFMPVVPYMTFLDKYVIHGVLLLMLMSGENVGCYYLDPDQRELADKITAIAFEAYWLVMHFIIVSGHICDFLRPSWARTLQRQKESEVSDHFMFANPMSSENVPLLVQK